MGFGSQVHDRMRLEALQYGAHRWVVDDVGLDEFVTTVVGDAGQGLQIAGIGQFVEVKYLVVSVANQMANQCGANETGTTGDENTHAGWPFSVRR